MSINKAEQSLEDQLVNRIKDLEDQMLQLKAYPQPIGADMIDVVVGTTSTVGPVNISAGGGLTALFQTYPVSDLVLTLFNFEITLYVDALDDAHKWPDGSALTSGQRNIAFAAWHDWQDSYSDAEHNFIRAFKVRAVNNDSSSHNLYLNYLPIFPRFTLA